MTAGHVLGGSPLQTQFLRDSGSYPASLDYTRKLSLGTQGNTGYYNGSRIDAMEINQADHLITNRMYIYNTTQRRITSTYAYASVSIGLKVCKSGKTTGVSCGSVSDIGQPAALGQGDPTFQEQIYTTFGVAGGDSGSPVYQQFNWNRAVGIVGGVFASGENYVGSISHLGDVDPGMVVYVVSDKRKDFILALYSHGLGRHADSGGYSYWRNTTMGSCTLTNARTTAAGIMKSTEFKSEYPLTSTNNKKLRVEKAYWAMLGRASDTAGFNSWLGTLTSETKWDQLVDGFINSAEFQIRVTGAGSGYDGDVC